MPPQIIFPSSFSCSEVVILDCLPRADLQTARRLHEHLIHICDGENTPNVSYQRIDDRASLFEALSEIWKKASRGLHPILHFEAHGSEKEGLLVGDDREPVGWEKIGAVLSAINWLTRNNVGVVMAACYGLHQLVTVDIEKPSPFHFLLGPPAEVSADLFEERMRAFYSKLFQPSSLPDALLELGDDLVKFQAEVFYCRSFIGYIRTGCVGKPAALRAETLLSRIVESGGASTPQELSQSRRAIKKAIKDAEHYYYSLGAIFLHGKRPSPTYEQIKDLSLSHENHGI